MLLEKAPVILSFHPCFDADRQIIMGDRALDSEILGAIAQAEAIILPQACSLELYRACAESRAALFPRQEVRFSRPGKTGQSLLFKELGFPHPETHVWLNVEAFENALSSGQPPHRVPYLIKADKGHEADGVFLVNGAPALEEALQKLRSKESSGEAGFISQALIDSKGNVLRAVVVGGRIITYWKRPAAPGRLITTISRGALVDHTWRPELQDEGRMLARSFSQKTACNLAAIDFVFDLSSKKPAPHFLEVNYYFARRGLGGSENYYRLLHEAIREWLKSMGMNPADARLV